MNGRTIAIGVAGVLALAGLLWAWDALVVTEEERLAAFVADATGPVTFERVERARRRWVDLSRQPFELSAPGATRVYGAGDEEQLMRRGAAVSRMLGGGTLRALTSRIEVDGDRATVSMRVLLGRRGGGQLEWRLDKDGDDWLVSRLVVRR